MAIQQDLPSSAKPKRPISRLVAWGLAAFLALSALAHFAEHNLGSGLVLVAGFLLVIPTTNDAMAERLGFRPPLWASFVVALSCLVLAGSLMQEQRAEGAAPGQGPQVAAPEYRPVSLTDFKLDASKMRGQKVELQGYYLNIGGNESLGIDVVDSTAIPIGTENTSREERKALLECGYPCSVTIRGVVRQHQFLGWGVVADSVSVD